MASDMGKEQAIGEKVSKVDLDIGAETAARLVSVIEPLVKKVSEFDKDLKEKTGWRASWKHDSGSGRVATGLNAGIIFPEEE